MNFVVFWTVGLPRYLKTGTFWELPIGVFHNLLLLLFVIFVSTVNRILLEIIDKLICSESNIK